MKALGRGFSAAPFKTFTIHTRNATKGGSHLAEDLDSEVCHKICLSDRWMQIKRVCKLINIL